MEPLASLFFRTALVNVVVFFFAAERDDDEEAAEEEPILPAAGVDFRLFPPLADEVDGEEEDFILVISASKVLTTASRSVCLDREWTSRETKGTNSVRGKFPLCCCY